ncbi:uncharacterized protein LOC133628003 [Colius striatus]|uniref:uncharacterized protein LOC133628003 n=1 Tax=Colius striatus TaxID=57412 RepID=UPI002B1E0680|nr:uncharacterized protein LOC133628003 [Colius striatus]
MPRLADPETLPLPPCRCRNRSRSRSRLLPLLAALGAAALGAAAAATALLGMLRGGTPPQAATAAHVLLSAGSLSGPGWRYEEGINGVFLSGDVQMTAGKLQVTAGGLYLLYGQFTLTCTASSCPHGTIALQLSRTSSPRPLLTVPLTLPDDAGPDLARSGLTQAVGQLQPGDILSLEMVGDVAGDGWQLSQDEREGNFVGLLRIAGG